LPHWWRRDPRTPPLSIHPAWLSAVAARNLLKTAAARVPTFDVPAPTPGAETILIVDDDAGVTQTFARMLKLEGYQVRTAANAETGLLEAERTRPDAIILDLRMPIVDGLGFLRRLRASEARGGTPVAIVTGDYFLSETVSAELKALGAALSYKPLWLEDLVDLARSLLKSN
jgi:DNA-binding response OmpR family regulator